MATTTTRRHPSTPQALLTLLGFAAAVAVAAVVGGLAASSAGSDYASLDRPAWAPPSWLFGPVWTVLYVMIAVAGWLVWRTAGWAAARLALSVFAAQLVLNMLWTPLFFGAGQYGLAFLDIGLLWGAVIWCIVLFRRHSRLAALLLVPYLLWVTYAAALNLSIWLMN